VLLEHPCRCLCRPHRCTRFGNSDSAASDGGVTITTTTIAFVAISSSPPSSCHRALAAATVCRCQVITLFVRTLLHPPLGLDVLCLLGLVRGLLQLGVGLRSGIDGRFSSSPLGTASPGRVLSAQPPVGPALPPSHGCARARLLRLPAASGRILVLCRLSDSFRNLLVRSQASSSACSHM
jgi:hypothetical protein